MSDEKILEALEITKFLTIRQVARLFYGKRRDGQPAKARTVRPAKDSPRAVHLEPGSDSAKWILNDMCQRKVRVRDRDYPLLMRYDSDNLKRENYYHRHNAEHISLDEKMTYGHDMAVVVSYVLLETSGELDGFQRYWDPDQAAEYGKKWGLYPDAVFALAKNPDHMFFLEVDGGTEWETPSSSM
jgi:hypothetical protein